MVKTRMGPGRAALRRGLRIYPAFGLISLVCAFLGEGLSAESLRAPAAGTSVSVLEAEAPKSLFSLDLDEAKKGEEAELIVSGAWEASATGNLGVVISPSGGLALSGAQPLLFTQRPDLFLSFLLFKKLFVEARVTENLAEARYALGYRGAQGEVLEEVRLGNDGISFPSYPYLSLGPGSSRSFGIAARAGSGAFSGHAMLRYDQADRVEKRFVGRAEVTETIIAANSFQRGRWFKLSATIKNLELYAESPVGTLVSGDTKYRRLEAGEFAYSVATGFIGLARAAETKLYAWYENVEGTKQIGERATCLLYDPEVFGSGAELLSRYPLVLTAADEVFVRNRASGLRDEGYEARFDPAGFIEVRKTDDDATSGRQPFVEDMPTLYTTDFSEKYPTGPAPLLTHEIVVRRLSAAKEITLDQNLVEGSVEVYRNGVPDYAFTVDKTAGILTLANPPGLQEEIRVSYLRESAERRAGSLAAGLGGSFNFGADRSAWAALGLRWSLPGQSYASDGLANPGTLTLTLGARDAEGDFRSSLALAGSWTTEEASGRYRIEGMESGSRYATSFSLVTELAQPATASVTELEEDALALVFPRLVNATHRDGSVQKALKIAVTQGGDLRLAKLIEAPPFVKLKEVSFYARVKGNAPTSLSLTIDDGGRSSALSMKVPREALNSAWRRFVLRYGRGDSTLYYQATEGGALIKIDGAETTVDLSCTSASRLVLDAAGLDANSELWIDEISLEESSGRAALLGQGTLSYERDAWALGPALKLGRDEIHLLSGLALKADATAASHDAPYAACGIVFGTRLGMLDLVARARGRANENEVALQGGHELKLPLGPLSLADRFDYNPEEGSFGREDAVGLRLPAALSLEAKSTTTFTPSTVEGESGLLRQDWNGTIAAGSAVVATLKAATSARPSLPPVLPKDYFAAWIAAFPFLIPVAEDEATRREVSFGLSCSAGADRQFALAQASYVGEPGASDGLRRDEARLRLALPLRLPGDFGLTPYYERRWKEKRAGAGLDLLYGAESALKDLFSARPLWESYPFLELWDARSYELFRESAAASATALDAPEVSYTPELGLALSRHYGSFVWDLFLPSSFSLALRRELVRSGDSLSSSLTWEWGLKTAALNLFGAFGVRPLGLPFESDEYFGALQGKVAQVDGESALRAKLTHQQIATLYARDNRDSLGIEHRFSLASEPALREWSERFSASLSFLRERHWLLDLYRLALGLAPGSAGGAPYGTPQSEGDRGKKSLFSHYLESLAHEHPQARSTYGFSGELSSKQSDASAPPLSFSLEESAEGKLTVPQKLTLKAKAACSQKYDGKTGTLTFDLLVSLGLVVSF